MTIVFSRCIEMLVQPLTEEDRNIIGLGVGVTGYMKAYCKADYGGVAPDVGDQIETYDGLVFVVDQVEGKWGGRSAVFRKLILRRLDN